MRSLVIVLTALAFSLAACSSDPLSHKVDDNTISKLPADKMANANKLKEAGAAAKQAWQIAKWKLQLTRVEFIAAQGFATAAVAQVAAIKERLALKNKGLPIEIPVGAMEKAVTESALAAKNLKYYVILTEMYEMRVEYLFQKWHALRAKYFSEVVEVMHGSNNPAAAEHKKSKYIAQYAQQTEAAEEAGKEVKKHLATIERLKKEVGPLWKPSLSCNPAPATPATPVAPPGTPAPGAAPGAAPPPASDGAH